MRDPAGPDVDSRAECVAIDLPYKFDLQPRSRGETVIAQQRRRTVDIVDENIQIAIVIEIAQRGAASGPRLLERRAGAFSDAFEGAVSQVAEQ